METVITDLNTHLLGYEIESIGNIGVKNAIDENKRLNIPIVYSVDNTIYYEYNGIISKSSPFQKLSKN
jgi:hypothetical protein